MKKIKACLILCFLLISAGRASGEEIKLVECRDKTLGYSILCDSQWPTKRGEGQITMTVADLDTEKVTLTISAYTEEGLVFADITPSALQNFYGYADGFRFATTKLHGRPAIRIEAEPEGNHEQKLLDYFLIKKSTLYRISLAVQPPRAVFRYRPLYNSLMHSFQLIGPIEQSP